MCRNAVTFPFNYDKDRYQWELSVFSYKLYFKLCFKITAWYLWLFAMTCVSLVSFFILGTFMWLFNDNLVGLYNILGIFLIVCFSIHHYIECKDHVIYIARPLHSLWLFNIAIFHYFMIFTQIWHHQHLQILK